VPPSTTNPGVKLVVGLNVMTDQFAAHGATMYNSPKSVRSPNTNRRKIAKLASTTSHQVSHNSLTG